VVRVEETVAAQPLLLTLTSAYSPASPRLCHYLTFVYFTAVPTQSQAMARRPSSCAASNAAGRGGASRSTVAARGQGRGMAAAIESLPQAAAASDTVTAIVGTRAGRGRGRGTAAATESLPQAAAASDTSAASMSATSATDTAAQNAPVPDESVGWRTCNSQRTLVATRHADPGMSLSSSLFKPTE
jgi:hypothetical protein